MSSHQIPLSGHFHHFNWSWLRFSALRLLPEQITSTRPFSLFPCRAFSYISERSFLHFLFGLHQFQDTYYIHFVVLGLFVITSLHQKKPSTNRRRSRKWKGERKGDKYKKKQINPKDTIRRKTWRWERGRGEMNDNKSFWPEITLASGYMYPPSSFHSIRHPLAIYFLSAL